MKKLILTTIVLMSIASFGFTQQQYGVGAVTKNEKSWVKKTEVVYKYKLKGNAAETTLWINELSADIEIEGGAYTDIVIKALNYEGLPEKAKGLTPLGGSGPENTGVGLSLKHDGNKISLSAAHNKANDTRYIISVPKNMKIKVDYDRWRSGDVIISNMTNEVEARVQIGDLKIKNVTGPIVAHTLSSDIEVEFSELSQDSPSSISSTSGDIDVKLPSSVKGTFKMTSTSGGVYTDMDFDLGESVDTNRITGSSATGKLNGGGVKVSFNCLSGDIYVRKSN